MYNIAVRSGAFDIFRRWIVTNTPPDQRVLLLVIGFAFGALLEGERTRTAWMNRNSDVVLCCSQKGVAGFGTPGAICSALMASLG